MRGCFFWCPAYSSFFCIESYRTDSLRTIICIILNYSRPDASSSIIHLNYQRGQSLIKKLFPVLIIILSFMLDSCGNSSALHHNKSDTPLSHITDPLIDVRSFGAVCDGATDDIDKINDAADYAKTVNGFVYIPRDSTCAINGMITIENGARGIISDGGTIKYIIGKNMSGILLKGIHSGAAVNVNDCIVEGLLIDANNLWGVAIYGENISSCKILNNKIVNVANGHGILIRAFRDGLSNAIGNKISGNYIEGDTSSKPPHHGIVLDSELNLGVHGSAIEYWKANFTAADATYYPTHNVVSNNYVKGGYYGLSLSTAKYTTVTKNVFTSNVRNISVQNVSCENEITHNILLDSYSSGVHVAYGSNSNIISNNEINSTRANGQGLLNCYVGSTANKFLDNIVTSTGEAKPKWLAYVGPHSSSTEISRNKFYGAASKAAIAIESAWDNTVTNDASYGYGETSLINNFANRDLFQIVISNNVIDTSSKVPIIFLSQISDDYGNYALMQINISYNKIIASSHSKQLELFEENFGSLENVILIGNHFAYSPANSFILPRGLAHFTVCSDNTVDESPIPFTPNDPIVEIWQLFSNCFLSPSPVQ